MKKIAIVLLTAFLAFPALAADKKDTPVTNANAPDPNKIPVLQKIKEQGPDLSYDYLGRRFGTDAWLITGKGVMQVVYTTPKGLAAVVGGVLIGPDGQEVSSTMQREFTENNPDRAAEMLELARQKPGSAAPSPVADKKDSATTSKSEIVWDQLGKLGLITFVVKDVVTPAPIVYAVLDPDQPESNETFEKLRPLAESGKIVLHVVPLLTKRVDRLLDVAHVVTSSDAPALWEKVLAGEKIDLPETIDPKGAEGINNNVAFAQGMKLYTVPFLFYRVPNKDGWGKVQALKGVPKDWEKLLKELETPGN